MRGEVYHSYMTPDYDTHYNSPSEGWFHLEMEKKALDKERLQWAGQRDQKLRPETVELDEKLERLDPARFATYQKLEHQVNILLSKVRFDGVNNNEGSCRQEEADYKRSQLYSLAHENMDMKVRPCKWKRRQWLSEQIWHCSEEEIRCEDKASILEARIKLLKPDPLINT